MASKALPHGWKLVKLGELGEVNRGRSRHRPRYAEHLYGGPYPFIQTGDIRESGGRITKHSQTYSEEGLRQSRLWPAGTLCITIAANIAETAILTFPACFPDSVVGFIANDRVCDVRFVEYTFRQLRKRIQWEASGSVQDNINLETLNRLTLALPDLPAQKAIVAALGALDDKIDLNRRMNETLEAIARAIFKAWFVDFEPVREGRTSSQYVGSSSAGEIPRGWTKTVLQDLAEYFVGGDWGADTVAGEAVNPAYCIRGADIPNLQAAGIGKMPTRFLKPASLGKRALKPGDLVVEVSGGSPTQSTGRPVLVTRGLLRRLTMPVVCSNFCRMLRLKSSQLSSFVYYWLLDLYDRGEFLQFENGTTGIKNLAFTQFAGSYPIVTPPADILQEFDSLVEPLSEMQQRNGAESRTLATLRDTLLPKLLSGEIRVKQAEKMVGEAV